MVDSRTAILTGAKAAHRLHRDLGIKEQIDRSGGGRVPTYGEVFAIARQTATALEKLAHVTGVVGVSLDTQLPAHKESAEKFWAPWIKQ
jgi:hypothetical protein